MKSLLISLIVVVSTQSLAAQETVPAASAAPHKAMQKLSPLVGVWSLSMEYSPDNGVTWQKAPRSQVELSFQLKQLIIGERPLDDAAATFQTRSFYSYDQYRKTYRIAVMDDTWGLMDIYEGNVTDGVLVATNLKAGTFFPIDEITPRAFRLSIDLSNSNERQMKVEKSDDGGRSWQPNFKLNYKKIINNKALHLTS